MEDRTDPCARLKTIVDALVSTGNSVIDGGFVLNPDGWRCRLTAPINFDLVRSNFDFPVAVVLSEETDSILDRDTWCVLEGPGTGGRHRDFAP
jgi:hypothetical protein